MNLPNKLTVSRIFLTFAFIGFLFAHGLIFKALAFVTFIVASLTDLLDGYLAKSRGEVTDFGRLMDPIADKVLVLAAFISFVEIGIVPAWMVIIIIFREAAITGLRLFALSKGKVIPADGGGKHKTVWQLSSIILILVFLMVKEAGNAGVLFWTPESERLYRNAIFVVMCVTVMLTLASGVSYLVKNKGVYANEKKN